MAASKDDAAAMRLRRWWLSPPGTRLRLLINPWEYRHLQVSGTMRIGGGVVGVAAGVVCLSYGVYGWAVFFLALAVLNFLGGSWYLRVGRSASA